VNSFAVGLCRPDITFVLDLDGAIARERMRQRPRPLGVVDRMEQEPEEFYDSVRHGYLRLAKKEPDRIRVIDASGSVEGIQAEIWRHLEERLKQKIEQESRKSGTD